jgi:hypothetical protein
MKSLLRHINCAMFNALRKTSQAYRRLPAFSWNRPKRRRHSSPSIVVASSSSENTRAATAVTYYSIKPFNKGVRYSRVISNFWWELLYAYDNIE